MTTMIPSTPELRAAISELPPDTDEQEYIIKLLNDGNAIVRGTVESNLIEYYVIDDLITQTTLHIPVVGIKLYYLTADTINGVQVNQPTEIDTLNLPVFYNSLKRLSDGEEIATYATQQMFDQIQTHYGIR
jgi:hypothetical protein